jgi:hypothetical protein
MVQVDVFLKKKKEVPQHQFIAEPHFDMLLYSNYFSSRNTEILF